MSRGKAIITTVARQGYDVIRHDGISPAELNELRVRSLPYGSDWGKYKGFVSLRGFPLKSGRMALAYNLVLDRRDEIEREGILFAKILVLDLEDYLQVIAKAALEIHLLFARTIFFEEESTYANIADYEFALLDERQVTRLELKRLPENRILKIRRKLQNSPVILTSSQPAQYIHWFAVEENLLHILRGLPREEISATSFCTLALTDSDHSVLSAVPEEYLRQKNSDIIFSLADQQEQANSKPPALSLLDKLIFFVPVTLLLLALLYGIDLLLFHKKLLLIEDKLGLPTSSGISASNSLPGNRTRLILEQIGQLQAAWEQRESLRAEIDELRNRLHQAENSKQELSRVLARKDQELDEKDKIIYIFRDIIINQNQKIEKYQIDFYLRDINRTMEDFTHLEVISCLEKTNTEIFRKLKKITLIVSLEKKESKRLEIDYQGIVWPEHLRNEAGLHEHAVSQCVRDKFQSWKGKFPFPADLAISKAYEFRFPVTIRN
jgi:hypothetical protein